MKYDRSSGIILHPTSLPGPYGIGDLGSDAYKWVDFLTGSGCTLWQILPLGPTGYGDSPYQSFSAFAGNPYLVSPQVLLEQNLLHPDDLVESPNFVSDQIDFGPLISWKLSVLDRAYNRFQHLATAKQKAELADFQAQNSAWLEDFALFMALKEAHGGAPWPAWEKPLRDRQPQAIAQARQEHSVAIERQIFRQFLFFQQWIRLRAYANQKEIRIIGDVPIFVAHDSSDVWAHPELFYMDEAGNPTSVAGVPPDYFSPTGQLWGNPLYRWDYHASTGYAWWLARLRAVLQMVDIIRLDHFRGFVAYWEVPAGETTAEKGHWVPGPGAAFFDRVEQALGDLPLLAEDLGDITADVIALREQYHLPGMKILQFAFETGPEAKFLPHNYTRDFAAYTGTHDNDTSRGWFVSRAEEERDFCLRYLDANEKNVVWKMIRAVWSSVAMFSLAPMQDFLNLGTEARMNFPGKPSGNWTWRMTRQALSLELKASIQELNYLYGRKKVAVKKDKSSFHGV